MPSGIKRKIDNIDSSAKEDSTRSQSAPTESESMALIPSSIQRLRLEAIFHPKFENENSKDQVIRQKMKDNVASSSGYLEVSIKHSGSLLLWSGGQRFYSKNASENRFTHAGEILLRQHLARAFWNESSNGAMDNPEAMYNKCSDYVEAHRLTLSFEVVTSVLGDHGARPKRDFLILTAIADRNRQTFFSTADLVALAQQFRLPHNDSWVFSSVESVDALFSFYDTSRETGLAQSTVSELSESAEAHVWSLYPHSDFQGEIMEGIVIRYVPCRDIKKALETIDQLSQASRELLERVPVSRPGSFDLAGEESARWPPVLSASLRALAAASAQPSDPMDVAKFEEDIRNLLTWTESRRQVVKLSKMDMPSKTRSLLESDDTETRRVARLIQTLSNTSDKVEYSVYRESLPEGTSRFLCIIHVLQDKTFVKFQKSTQPGELPLFRGFSFELAGDDGDLSLNQSTEETLESSDTDCQEEPVESLMLKMKFLPYMVRTFACRNGLSILKRGGPPAFITYTNGLMNTWQISPAGQRYWRPFFRGWAKYAHECLQAMFPVPESKELPPLSSSDYLGHLELFTKLYNEKKIAVEGEDELSDCPFRGIVLVVSITQDISERVADFVADQLGGARRIKDIALLNSEVMGLTLDKGGGAVCSATVEDGYGPFRKLLKEYGKHISILMFQCSAEDLAELLLDKTKESSLVGKIKSWKKTRCTMFHLSGDSLFPKDATETGETQMPTPNADFSAVIKQLQVTGVVDDRPGMLVFFPGIPGCGKSSLLDATTQDEIRKMVEGAERPRTLTVQVGDKTKQKFWTFVKQVRLQDRSGVLIADKNVPVLTWENVAKIASMSKALAVPVVPDKAALQTTRVVGLRGPDGSYCESGPHFYPFSLQYLAVCMSRVLARKAGSHDGKLDSAKPETCMVVVKFFGLYRKLQGDEFVNSLCSRFEVAGAVVSQPIEVPFFGNGGKEEPLPKDLEAILTEAIQAQFAIDIVKGSELTPAYLTDLQGRLRASIERHASLLNALTVDVSFSRERFLARLSDRLSMLDTMETYAGKPPAFATIASIDISSESVLQLLRDSVHDPRLAGCFELLCEKGNASIETTLGGSKVSSKFVSKPHVTMSHCRTVSQLEMRSTFGPLVGSHVRVSVTGILWSSCLVALAVQLPCTTVSGQALPASVNDFLHVTLWCETGTAPKDANTLPSQVATGQAQRVNVLHPVVLDGVVSLWEL